MQKQRNATQSNAQATQSNAQATQATYYSNAQLAILASAHVQQHKYAQATQSNATATRSSVTKKQQVINMCSAANGTTVAAIASNLQISKVAARSLIGDVRRSKIIVRCINNVYKI